MFQKRDKDSTITATVIIFEIICDKRGGIKGARARGLHYYRVGKRGFARPIECRKLEWRAAEPSQALTGVGLCFAVWA
jgi:hypothetical protein